MVTKTLKSKMLKAIEYQIPNELGLGYPIVHGDTLHTIVDDRYVKYNVLKGEYISTVNIGMEGILVAVSESEIIVRTLDPYPTETILELSSSVQPCTKFLVNPRYRMDRSVEEFEGHKHFRSYRLGELYCEDISLHPEQRMYKVLDTNGILRNTGISCHNCNPVDIVNNRLLASRPDSIVLEGYGKLYYHSLSVEYVGNNWLLVSKILDGCKVWRLLYIFV